MSDKTAGQFSENLANNFNDKTAALIFALGVPKDKISKRFKNEGSDKNLGENAKNELKNKADELEKRLDKLSIDELEKLKALYFKLKDTRNYERINEKILEKKLEF